MARATRGRAVRLPRAAARTATAGAAARARAESLVTEVKKRKRRIAEDFHAIGVALRALAAPTHYRALGFDSFEQLLADRKLMSRFQAFKLMEVAEAFPREQALELLHHLVWHPTAVDPPVVSVPPPACTSLTWSRIEQRLPDGG